MKTLGQRVRELRKELKLTQKALGKSVGVSSVSVTQWESDINRPRGENLYALTKALKCEPSWLLHGTNTPLKCDASIEAGPDIQGYYPLLDWVQAGDWTCINAIQPCEAEHFPCLVPCSPKTFALKVRGESMCPKFEENELIFVDPEAEATSGKYVIARLDDDNQASFKQLIIEGNQKYLKAANPDWPNKFLEINGNCTIIGVVISATRFL